MYTVRKAVPGELDRVWELVRAAVAVMNAEGNLQWAEDYPMREDFGAALEAGELYAVCGAEGDILGVVVLNTREEPEYGELDGWSVPGPALALHKLAVDPAARGRGAASALLEFAAGLAGKRGLRSLRADTYALNAKMQGLFRKFGFRQVGEVRFPGRPLAFYVYEKLL